MRLKAIKVNRKSEGEEVRKRELTSLEKIRDNYEKIVLSIDINSGTTHEGIKVMNIVDYLQLREKPLNNSDLTFMGGTIAVGMLLRRKVT